MTGYKREFNLSPPPLALMFAIGQECECENLIHVSIWFSVNAEGSCNAYIQKNSLHPMTEYISSRSRFCQKKKYHL